MAKEKDAVAVDVQAANPAPLFEKADLIAASKAAFGVMPEILIGALHDVEGPLTKEDAAKKLADFLTREVK